jgi:hypothetical protein
VKHQIQWVENPTPTVVISMDAARIDNAILLDSLTSNVALEEPEIGSTDPNIPIDNNCMGNELQWGCQGAVGITKFKVTKATGVTPSPLPASNDSP